MKLTEIRCIPGKGIKMVKTFIDGKEFCYSNDGPATEIFEIYYFGSSYDVHKKLGGASHPTTSRSYLLWQEKAPKKYTDVLAFLKEEYAKIDWDVLEVRNALTGEYYEELEA